MSGGTHGERDAGGRASDPGEVVADLQRRLAGHADAARRDWWRTYLKGTAEFRGVAMAEIRAEVSRTWSAEVAGWPRDRALALALGLMHERFSEDKLAGVLLLAEHLLGALGTEDLPALAGPLADGAIADWGVCDWYAVKVLAPLCARDGEPFARALVAWSDDGAPLWQRRAPAAALAVLAGKPAPFPELAALALEVCGRLVTDPQRFAQTAVGWLLRELSKQEPDAVAAFVAGRDEAMSAEARRMATAKLRGGGRRR